MRRLSQQQQQQCYWFSQCLLFLLIGTIGTSSSSSSNSGGTALLASAFATIRPPLPIPAFGTSTTTTRTRSSCPIDGGGVGILGFGSSTTSPRRRNNRGCNIGTWLVPRGGGGGGEKQPQGRQQKAASVAEQVQPNYDTTKTTTLASATTTTQSTLSDTTGEEEYEYDDYNELPFDFPRRKDALIALAAVRKACNVTQCLQPLRGGKGKGTIPSSSTSTSTSSKERDDDSSSSSSSMEMIEETGGSDDDEEGITTVTKIDLSPVTVGDFAAQAIILNHLYQRYGIGRKETEKQVEVEIENNKDGCCDFDYTDTYYIAEESSDALQTDSNLAELIYNVTKHYELDSIEHVKTSIDLGKSYLLYNNNNNNNNQELQSKSQQNQRIWCLDPIDGTKGFLRGKYTGGQYAIGLALLENGIPTIGIVGCPNLPMSSTDHQYEWTTSEIIEDEEEETTNTNINNPRRGCIFIASQGGGCYQLPLFPTTSRNTTDNIDNNDDSGNDNTAVKRIHVTANDGSDSMITSPQKGRFVIGMEKSIADALGECNAIAQILHGGKDGTIAINTTTNEIINSQRFDSMVKYALIARGQGEYYVRLPSLNYIENIWDHAAGVVILQQAGGQITDTNGQFINFNTLQQQGRISAKLSKDIRGILASNGGIFHQELVQAYQQQLKEQQNENEEDQN